MLLSWAALLLAACGGGGDGEAPPLTPAETRAAALTPQATVRGEIEPVVVDLSHVSFVDNLLAKVEDGEWTLGEGLVATLKLFAGEVDAASVLREPDLLERESTGILEMASEYLEAGRDAGAKAEISRLLDLLVFSNARLEAMAGLSPVSGLPGRLALGAAGGPEEDCLKFFHGDSPAGVSQCLEFKSTTIAGKTYRVFFPAPSLPAAGWTEADYELALIAVEETIPVFNGLGKMPPANVVFSVQLGGAWAQAWSVAGEPCGIAVYTSMQGIAGGDFKQVVAHELAHCFQEENFAAQGQVDYEHRRWREEGLAEYLSNVAYPTNNEEWDPGRLQTLAEAELWTTLFDRAYANAIWFQYLANGLGDEGLLELVGSLPTSGGREEQVAALAAYPNMNEIYQSFAKAMTDGKVADTGGGFYPYKISDVNNPIVRITAPGKGLLNWQLPPFGVYRRHLIVQEGKQACLDFNGEGLVLDAARPSPGPPWSQVPSALPEGAQREGDSILLVTTTEPDGALQLDVIHVGDFVGADAAAGEGIEGEWVVDGDSIRPLLKVQFPETKVDSISGEIRATFGDDGKVEVVYDAFEVTGHSDGDSLLARTLGEEELHTETTITISAQGTTSYEISSGSSGGSDIEFSAFEDTYLKGTQTLHYYQGPYALDFGGNPDAIAVDELEREEEQEPRGWNVFSLIQQLEFQCGGEIMRFLDWSTGEPVAVLRRR